MSNPTDIARLGHRYQVLLTHTVSARTITAHRLQRAEPTRKQQTDVYHELGSVDPTGSASDAPEYTIALEENVHDCSLDLLLAGLAANVTVWNAGKYIQDGLITTSLLERDNSDVVVGEMEYDKCVLSEVTWAWQMNQPITGRYTLNGRAGKRWTTGHTPHSAWAAGDLVTPGGIKIKDARLFLGGSAAGNRIFRLQSFTLKIALKANSIKEAGNRSIAGWVVEPPDSTLDIDLIAADHQPDDILYATHGTPVDYYDYQNSVDLTGSAIRVYDPDDDEAATVIRAWGIDYLRLSSATPVSAQVRGTATKKYSFVLPRVTTPQSGGIQMFVGDIA